MNCIKGRRESKISLYSHYDRSTFIWEIQKFTHVTKLFRENGLQNTLISRIFPKNCGLDEFAAICIFVLYQFQLQIIFLSLIEVRN